MKKWAAWSFFGVVVACVFVVKMCVPDTRTGPVTPEDLTAIADSSLTPELHTVAISELKVVAPDTSRISQIQDRLLYAGLASDAEWQEILASFEDVSPWQAMESTQIVPVSSLELLIGAVSWNLARVRLLLDYGDVEEACDLLAELSRDTAMGLDVATTADELAIAGMSRGLLVIFTARHAESLRECGLGESWVTVSHRERLFEVLQAEFFEDLLPQMAEKSGRDPWEWAPEISGLPDNDASRVFFETVLSGHPSAFDPEETATVASDDLVGLRTGLIAHWREFEAWGEGRLDRTAKTVPPILFQLEAEDLDSKLLLTLTKKLLAEVDNPLGALMLDSVVQNYASAAESAYFMDFQEAAVLFALTGGTVTSPISGAVISPPVDGVYSERITQVDERFGLIRSLAEFGWQP